MMSTLFQRTTSPHLFREYDLTSAVPTGKKLRACLVCGLIKNYSQFQGPSVFLFPFSKLT